MSSSAAGSHPRARAVCGGGRCAAPNRAAWPHPVVPVSGPPVGFRSQHPPACAQWARIPWIPAHQAGSHPPASPTVHKACLRGRPCNPAPGSRPDRARHRSMVRAIRARARTGDRRHPGPLLDHPGPARRIRLARLGDFSSRFGVRFCSGGGPAWCRRAQAWEHGARVRGREARTAATCPPSRVSCRGARC